MRNAEWKKNGRGDGLYEPDGTLVPRQPLNYGAGDRAYDHGGFGDPYDCIGVEHENELLMELENA